LIDFFIVDEGGGVSTEGDPTAGEVDIIF